MEQSRDTAEASVSLLSPHRQDDHAGADGVEAASSGPRC